MAYSSETPNIGIPQWTGSDIPQWSEVTKAFNKIDTADGNQMVAISVNAKEIEKVVKDLELEKKVSTGLINDVTDLEDAQNEISSKVNVLMNFAEIQEKVNTSIAADSKEMKENLVNVMEKLSSHDVSIDYTGEIAESLALINNSVDENSLNISELQETLQKVQTTMSSMNGRIEGIGDTVDSLTDSINNIADDVEEVRTDFAPGTVFGKYNSEPGTDTTTYNIIAGGQSGYINTQLNSRGMYYLCAYTTGQTTSNLIATAEYYKNGVMHSIEIGRTDGQVLSILLPFGFDYTGPITIRFACTAGSSTITIYLIVRKIG